MRANRTESDVPDDLIPAYKARRLLACSASALRLWASQGKIGQWRHPDRTGFYYDRAEVEDMRAGFRRTNGSTSDTPGPGCA